MISTTNTGHASTGPLGILAAPRKLADRPVAKAAVLLAAFGLGIFQGYSWSEPRPSPVAYEGGSLVAVGALEHALYDPTVGGVNGTIAVGEVFKGSLGERCRKFADGGVEGTACWRQGDWRILEMRQD